MVIEEENKISVEELMTSDVVSTTQSSTLQQVAELMDNQNVGSVVIMDDTEPVGIITERDFAVKMALNSFSSDTKASQIMSSPVIHVSPKQSIADVVDIMAKRNIHKFPVISDGDVVGIITGTDFLRLYSRSSAEEMKKTYEQFVNRIYSKDWN